MRRIILLIAIILTVFGLLLSLSPYLLELVGLDVPLKRYFVEKMFKEESTAMNIDNFHIGLGNLEISNVALSDESRDLQVEIDRIRLHFNFWKLWTNLAEPQNALTTIYFQNPVIILDRNEGEKKAETKSKAEVRDSKQVFDDRLLTKIENIKSLGKVQIREGEILIKNSEGKLIKLAGNINGWLDTSDFESIVLNASGRIFDEDRNILNISSRINIPGKKLESTISLDEYHLSTPSINEMFNYLPVTSGKLDGYLTIENHGFRIDSTMVNGNIKINSLSAMLDSMIIRDVQSDIHIENNQLSIENANGYISDKTPFAFKAFIDNILKPVLISEISAKKFPLSYFNRYVKQIPFNGSTIDLQIRVNTGLEQAIVQGQMYAKEVSVFKDQFNDFQLYFNWSPAIFGIDYFTVNWKGISILGKGDYDAGLKRYTMDLNGFQHLGQHVIFDRLSDKIQKFNVTLDYLVDNQKINGHWDYHLAQSQDTVLTVDGEIIGQGNLLSIISNNSRDHNLKLQFEIENYLSLPSIREAKLIDFPVHLITTAPVLQDIFKSISTEVSLTGGLDLLTGQILASPGRSKKQLFKFETTIKNLLEGNRRIYGDVDLFNLDGKYDFIFNNQFIGGEFDLGGGLNGELYVDITKEEQLHGQINFKDFKVVQAFSDTLATNDFRYQGNINGQIGLTGTVYEPKVSGELHAEKFVYNNIGYYQAELKFNADHTKVSADTVMISLNNLPIMDGRLTWTLLNNQITGFVSGSEIDLTDILRTLDIDLNTFSGMGTYSVRFDGNMANPHLDTEVKVTDGILVNVPFDLLELKLMDIVRPDGSFFNKGDHYFSLEKFYLTKEGQFHLNGIGKVPLNNRDELDLVANFDGDLFGLLHYWEPFFQDGVSIMDLSMYIGGTTDKLRIKSAKANIERGELWVRDVAPHIEDIKGVIELKPGTNQIDFVNFEAAIGNQKMVGHTVRNITTKSGRKLEHWYFDDLDLDFGILALETSDRGVELNIPGLMREEDRGKFHFTGKADGEPFYFAGPVRHPLAYGMVRAYNTRLTFPFLIITKPGQKPSLAVQFLSNMEWDVLTKPGENVVYFRDIPAYIDNVEAELFVDESSQGLEFLGILDRGTFATRGNLESTRGRLEYLDQNFRVDIFSVDFNENELFPDVSGRAWTTIRDSVGAVPQTIYLQLYVLDPETGQEQQQGNWENFKFKLLSADPQIGETQEQVLAYMGYSVDNIREKATSVGGAMTEKYLIRPLLRPIERALERRLGMDLVRFNSSIAKNLFYSSLGSSPAYAADPRTNLNPLTTNAPYLFLMQSSEVTVGKYLTQDIYLTYTGQLVSVYNQVDSGFDFNHSVGLEYRFLRNILLEFEYDRELMGLYRPFSERQYMEDFKIRLRHSFSF